jgi:hypothetical protein
VSDTPTEPAVPLLARMTPSEQVMAISNAMRQAAVDAATAPPGLSFGVTWEERVGVGAVVIVQGKNAFGVVQWEAPYDARGHRLSAFGGITF